MMLRSSTVAVNPFDRSIRIQSEVNVRALVFTAPNEMDVLDVDEPTPRQAKS